MKIQTMKQSEKTHASSDPCVVGPRLQRFCRRTQVAMVMAEEGSPIGGSRRWLLKRREAMAGTRRRETSDGDKSMNREMQEKILKII
nr:hypothetical protein Iba_chr07bCG10720 [Ipomoea batatas]